MKILIVDIFKKYRLSTNLPNSNSPLHYPPRSDFAFDIYH